MNKAYFIKGILDGCPVCVKVTVDGLQIGRRHDCNIVVQDSEVSRLHCILRMENDRLEVEDHSHNGTCVNGYRITGKAELSYDDILQVGNQTFEVCDGPTRLPEVGDEICGYRIEQCIGRGGMGAVYAVRLMAADERYAMKIMTLNGVEDPATLREKFMEEYKLLMHLRHDNISQVHYAAYDKQTDNLLFVMDLALYDDGKPYTLRDLGDFDECDIVGWFRELASALDYIHSNGVVHSDIKLENVLLTAGRKVKLTDFGVAFLLPGRLQKDLSGFVSAAASQVVGYTEHYVAPEIVKRGASPSVASDVYSLGVMLFHMLTGDWYDENPKAMDALGETLKMNWSAILSQMLCDDEHARETSLKKLVSQLHEKTRLGVRRRYQIEFNRRANRNQRLSRAFSGKIGKVRMYKPMPRSWKERICRGVMSLAVIGGFFAVCIHVLTTWYEYNQEAKFEAAQQEKAQAEHRHDFDSEVEKYDRVYADCTNKLMRLRAGCSLRARKLFKEGEESGIDSHCPNLDSVFLSLWNERIEGVGIALESLQNAMDVLNKCAEEIRDFPTMWEYSEDFDIAQVKEWQAKVQRQNVRIDEETFFADFNDKNDKFMMRQKLIEDERAHRIEATGCRERLIQKMEGSRLNVVDSLAKLKLGDGAISTNADYRSALANYQEGITLFEEAGKEELRKGNELATLYGYWQRKTDALRQAIDDFKQDGDIQDCICKIKSCSQAMNKKCATVKYVSVDAQAYKRIFDTTSLYLEQLIQLVARIKVNGWKVDSVYKSDVSFVSNRSILTISWRDIAFNKLTADTYGIIREIDNQITKLKDSNLTNGRAVLKGEDVEELKVAEKRPVRDATKLNAHDKVVPVPPAIEHPMRQVIFYERLGCGILGGQEGIKNIKRNGERYDIYLRRNHAESCEAIKIRGNALPVSKDAILPQGCWREGKINVGLGEVFQIRQVYGSTERILQFQGWFDVGLVEGPLIWLRYREY